MALVASLRFGMNNEEANLAPNAGHTLLVGQVGYGAV